jgi:hypothetical protein
MNAPPAAADLSTLTCTVPVFQPARDLDPVPLRSWDSIPAAAGREVAMRLAAAGFALVQAAQAPGPAAARQLAGQLGLGPVFVPPQYRDRPYADGQGVTRIGIGAATASHPAFGQATGQRLHCDGTLQRIGEVRTTLMLCARPARSGGASRLFNSAGAFAQLLREDPAAAAALTDPAALDRALLFLHEAAQPGSPHYTESTLTAGQGLLLANDLISHGRAAYEDHPACPRLILRTLFTRRRPVTGRAA